MSSRLRRVCLVWICAGCAGAVVGCSEFGFDNVGYRLRAVGYARAYVCMRGCGCRIVGVCLMLSYAICLRDKRRAYGARSCARACGAHARSGCARMRVARRAELYASNASDQTARICACRIRARRIAHASVCSRIARCVRPDSVTRRACNAGSEFCVYVCAHGTADVRPDGCATMSDTGYQFACVRVLVRTRRASRICVGMFVRVRRIFGESVFRVC